MNVRVCPCAMCRNQSTEGIHTRGPQQALCSGYQFVLRTKTGPNLQTHLDTGCRVQFCLLSFSCHAQGGCHPATDEQQVVMLSPPRISGELFAPAVEFDLKERGCQKPGIFVDHKLLMV